MDRDAVIAEIAVAFAGVARGDGVTLHEADVIDYYGTEEQRRAARALDTEASWPEVPDADIERYYTILSFLDLTGYRYYIPAYMTWALRHYDTSPSASVDGSIFTFALARDTPEMRAWQAERWSVFDEAQILAIRHFLEYMAALPPFTVDSGTARRALAEHFGAG